MDCIKTPISGLLVFKPSVYADNRGSFLESFNQKVFNEYTNSKYSFVQDNQSVSSKGVLRGLHFQNPPFEQGKLVRVVSGRILDVAVDIRKSSSTYGEHFSIELSAENHKQLWVPPGFAHGFISLEEDTMLLYKCTEYYNLQSEGSIHWNDPDLNINWNANSILVSEKDKLGEDFFSFATNFE